MTSHPGQKTVPCPLRAAALANSDAPSILAEEGEISYGELDARVSDSAERLRSLGLSEGARVGLYLPKNVGQFIFILASIRAGTTVVLLNTRVPPEGLAPLLETAACSALVSDDECARRVAEASGVRPISPQEIFGGGERTSGGDLDEIHLPLERPATIVFTSGSTGRAKAALHTFGNHYFSALGSNENIRLAPGDRWLHSLPLYHVGGLSILFRCLVSGAGISLPNPKVPVGQAVTESGATHVSLVATQLRRLLHDGDPDLSSLKAILLGGSEIPESLVADASERGLPVHTSYGLTEMSSQVTTTRPGATREELRTSGGTLRYREVETAEDGEILVKGEALFAGYGEGGELVRPFDGDGWFHTKDLGEIGGEGLLRVFGRKDNLFISGGENIQPEEVEEEMRRAPGVEEAAVVPVADEEFGFRPVAFVKGEIPPEELRGFLEGKLPRFAVPVSFHPWPDDAPEGMKVDRGFFRGRAEVLRRAR